MFIDYPRNLPTVKRFCLTQGKMDNPLRLLCFFLDFLQNVSTLTQPQKSLDIPKSFSGQLIGCAVFVMQ